jgi:hypothetical protein
MTAAHPRHADLQRMDVGEVFGIAAAADGRESADRYRGELLPQNLAGQLRREA